MTGPAGTSQPVPGRSGNAGAGSEPVGNALVPAIAGYTAARLLLIAAVTAVVYLLPRAFDVEVPLILALLVAIVLQLPMSWLLLPRQRYRVTELLQARTSQRRTERDRLRSALAGEGGPRPVDSDEFSDPRP